MFSLNKLPIKYQLWGGQGLTLILMALVAIIAIFNFHAVEQQSKQIAEQSQPTMVAALELQNSINATGKLLGYYMIDVSKKNAKHFYDSLTDLNQLMKNFQSRSRQVNSTQLQQYTDDLVVLNKQYIALQQRLSYLTEHRIENKSALKLAAEIVNPTYKETLQTLNMLVESENGEEATNQRKALFNVLLKIRQNWMLIVSSLRTYLSLPIDVRETEINTYIERHKALMAELQKYSDIYTFEQEVGIPTIIENEDTYFDSIQKIFEYYHKGLWRKDSVLVNNKLSPLMIKIDGDIKKLLIIYKHQFLMIIKLLRTVSATLS